MAIETGTKLGRYEIRSKIGAGGMGEVYRARDLELGRDVAIKVLPSGFSADTSRLQRFQQEACAAGALNHPNILIVHDVGAHDGSPYVVSELLEGETLRGRISGTPLAQRRAIDYALQIANGLAAAHEKGIIHRDLKPDNIFITIDGRVKILDFGLAKLIQLDNDQAQTDIPTRRVDTDPGVVMGTVGYMSPEQLKARTVDQRSDIFSFGAILYEMLSGRRAFHGESAAETMSAILKEDPPDLSATNKTVSPAMERLVNHCLEKNPEVRFHSARDLAFALEALSGSNVSAQDATTPFGPLPTRLKWREWLPWLVAGLFAVFAVLAFVLPYLRRAAEEAPVTHLSIPLSEELRVGDDLAVSPNGRRVVFVGNQAPEKRMLYLRALESSDPQPLAGTERAQFPFWSPDSRFIGFFADGRLKKIDTTGGGPPQTLCDVPDSPGGPGRGGTWNSEGVIVFAPSSTGGLHRVSEGGGPSTPITRLDESRQEESHRWPYFLPDGHHFLYFIRSIQPQNNAVVVGVLDGKDTPRRLMSGESNVAYAPPGYLLFWRDQTLLAQGFDASQLQLKGDTFPVAQKVRYFSPTSLAAFSVSNNGTLIYRSGDFNTNQPVWFDREGKQVATLGPPADYRALQLSPDQKRVAVTLADPQTRGMDVWLFDLARGANSSRFTFDAAADSDPIWLLDGNRIVFTSNRSGKFDLYQRSVSGVGNDELLVPSDNPKMTHACSSQFLIYEERDPKQKADLWGLPLLGERKAFPLLRTDFNETNADLSPDGRWIAYASDESGRFEVYVSTFPSLEHKVKVSTDGGNLPLWSHDGKELFYIAPIRKLMAVGVKAGTSFEPGLPKELFETRIAGGPGGRRYDVANDGKRFLIVTVIEADKPSPINVVLNWTAGLKK